MEGRTNKSPARDEMLRLTLQAERSTPCNDLMWNSTGLVVHWGEWLFTKQRLIRMSWLLQTAMLPLYAL